MRAIIVLSTTVAAEIFYVISLRGRRPESAGRGTATSRSPLDCARACSEDVGCRSIFYVPNIRSCQRHSVIYTNASTNLISGAPAMYYEMIAPPPFSCPADAVGLKTTWLPDWSIVKVRLFSDTKRNFTEAKSKCESEGGQLLEITTAVKMTFSFDLMHCPAYESMDYWIDGVYNLNTSVWETTDGKPLPMTQGDFWYAGKPNKAGTTNCVQMKNAWFDFLWDDTSCDDLLTAICDMR